MKMCAFFISLGDDQDRTGNLWYAG